jgi:hypothetical protein
LHKRNYISKGLTTPRPPLFITWVYIIAVVTAFMTEQLLNGADILSPLQQMRRKKMP